MSVYGYFVLTAAGHFLKLEFVRKMTGFSGQVTNAEQLSGEPAHFPDKICLEVYSEGASQEDKDSRFQSPDDHHASG